MREEWSEDNMSSHGTVNGEQLQGREVAFGKPQRGLKQAQSLAAMYKGRPGTSTVGGVERER